jgi:hypothetical protein
MGFHRPCRSWPKGLQMASKIAGNARSLLAAALSVSARPSTGHLMSSDTVADFASPRRAALVGALSSRIIDCISIYPSTTNKLSLLRYASLRANACAVA